MKNFLFAFLFTLSFILNCHFAEKMSDWLEDYSGEFISIIRLD